MNTDDLMVLAHRADDVRGRESARLAEVHDRIHAVRRQRQASVAVALVLLLVVGGVATALALRLGGDPSPAPVIPPKPTRTETARPSPLYVPTEGTKGLSLRQTVHSYNAGLLDALATPDDHDVRLSVWFTHCDACQEDYRHGLYWAMALTHDGYRTTRYLPLPGIGNAPQISSPAPGVFLLGDDANGEYWLLRTDGSLKPVTMVEEPPTPDDPRRVFPCVTDTPQGAPAVPDHTAGRAWCVLDVKTSTAAPLPQTWTKGGSSDGDPRLGQEPWGWLQDALNGPVSAWWLDHGVRHSQPLSTEGTVESIHGLGRDDPPAFANWRYGETTMRVYVVRKRSGGLGEPVRRPWLPLAAAETGTRLDPLAVRYARTADGALIAWSHWAGRSHVARLRIWRAHSLLRGEFRLVYDSSSDAFEDLRLRTEHGRLNLGPLASDDDGRSWSDPIGTWR